MEQLKALQRKNAFLKVLQDVPSEEANLKQEHILAETLQVVIAALQNAFGSSGALQRLGLLGRYLNMVGEPTLSNLVSTCPVNAAKSGSAVVDEQTCHVSIEGVDLAQSALEDFVNSYFMFHRLNSESSHDVLKYLPFLTFVESHIYGLDQDNEDSLLPKEAPHDRTAPCQDRQDRQDLDSSLLDPFGPLRLVLRERRWLTARLDQELKDGSRFWALERKLCATLASSDPRERKSMSRCDVEEALRLKSFDYRTMNLLLYVMRGEEPNEAHMDFLATSEVLVEIGDDLVDYFEDVE